ncbi:hypothetical protein CXF72_11645 [Psychromonas sp. MB-3u-54]|nr:hypothetical protein CXF72_11645 [Psychromonas sp. MB-3u-54]
MSVSFKNSEDNLRLKSVILEEDIVYISAQKKYVLNMRHVDKDDINELEKILKKMNFDNSVTIVSI